MAIYIYESEFNKSYRKEEQMISSNQVNYSIRMTEDNLLSEFGKLQSRAEFWITQFTFDPYGFTVPNFKNGEVNNVFIHICINENMLSKKYTLDDVIKQFAGWMFSYIYYKIKRDIEMDLELKNILRKKKISIKSIVGNIRIFLDMVIYDNNYLKYVPNIVQVALTRKTDNFIITDIDKHILPIDDPSNETLVFYNDIIDEMVDNKDHKIVYRAFLEDPAYMVNEYSSMGIVPADVCTMHTPYGVHAMIENGWTNHIIEEEALLEYGYLSPANVINDFFWWNTSMFFRRKLLLYEKKCIDDCVEISLKEEMEMLNEYLSFVSKYDGPNIVNLGNVKKEDVYELRKKAELLLKYISYNMDVDLENKNKELDPEILEFIKKNGIVVSFSD